MGLRPVRAFLSVGVVIAMAAWPGVPGVPVEALAAANLSKQQADVFTTKLTQIARARSGAPGTRRTSVTEGELNSWFVYSAQALLPAGVSAPELTIVGDGKVAGRVTVDLDALGKRRAPGGSLTPLSFLTGTLPVHVVGALRMVDGTGRFEMESADVSGIPVPKTLLQQLLTFYSRSDARPAGLNLDAAFPLPADIQKIEVGQGQAVVVQ